MAAPLVRRRYHCTPFRKPPHEAIGPAVLPSGTFNTRERGAQAPGCKASLGSARHSGLTGREVVPVPGVSGSYVQRNEVTLFCLVLLQPGTREQSNVLPEVTSQASLQ